MKYIVEKEKVEKEYQRLSLIYEKNKVLLTQSFKNSFQFVSYFDDSFTLEIKEFYDVIHALVNQTNDDTLFVFSPESDYLKAVHKTYDYYPLVEIILEDLNDLDSVYDFIITDGYNGSDNIFISSEIIYIYPKSLSWSFIIDRGYELALLVSQTDDVIKEFKELTKSFRTFANDTIYLKQDELINNYLNVSETDYKLSHLSKLQLV